MAKLNIAQYKPKNWWESVKGFFGFRVKTERIQYGLLRTGDRRLLRIPMQVEKSAMLYPEIGEAYYMSPRNQVQDKETGIYYQLLSETSQYPVCPIVKESKADMRKRANGIFHESFMFRALRVSMENVKSWKEAAAWWVIATPVVLAAILIGVKYWNRMSG